MLSKVEHSRSAYAPELECMAELQSSMRGFAVGDEYSSLWLLVQRRGLALVEALAIMRERITANLLTYSQEKDSTHFELEYVYRQVDRVRDFQTEDHAVFSGLMQMSLTGAKKARERAVLDPSAVEQAYAVREYEALLGVRRLRDLMSRAEEGDHVVLIYPPLPDGTSSIVYIYTIAERQEGETFVKVEGEVVDFSREGAEVLRGWLYTREEQRFVHSGVDNGETPAEASPFFTTRSADEVFAAAQLIARQPAYFSGKVTEAKTQSGNWGYYEQISQAGDFLTRVLGEVYEEMGGGALTQEALEQLELAFSFARSSILIHAHDGETSSTIISGNDLYADYHNHDELRRGDPTETEVLVYNQRIAARYGYLEMREEQAVGCPAAVLAALGFGSRGVSGRIGEVTVAIGLGECTAISCTACGCKDIPESASECPTCGWAPGKSVQEYRRKIQEQRKTAPNEHTTKPKLALVGGKSKNREQGQKKVKEDKKKAA